MYNDLTSGDDMYSGNEVEDLQHEHTGVNTEVHMIDAAMNTDVQVKDRPLLLPEICARRDSHY